MLKTIMAWAMYSSLRMSKRFPSMIGPAMKGNLILARYINKLAVRKGDAALEKFWAPVMSKLGKIRSKHIQEQMNIDVNDAGSIATYHDFEDPVYGTIGHWEINEDGHAMRCETKCELADVLTVEANGSDCSAFCQKVILPMEVATGQAMNPDYRVSLRKCLMDTGDNRCEFVHWIATEEEKAAEIITLQKI